MSSSPSAVEQVLQSGQSELLEQVADSILLMQQATASLTAELANRDMKDSPYATLPDELTASLLGESTKAMTGYREGETPTETVHPVRQLWNLCVSKARTSIQATNLVTPEFTNSSSTQAALNLQRDAIERGVEITRVYLLSRDLSRAVLDEVRNLVHRQLAVGINVQLIDRNLFETRVNFSKLQTPDFIIFDDEIVYATKIDDSRYRGYKEPRVKVHGSEGIVQYANAAWTEMMRHGPDVLRHENAHKIVDPHGGSADLRR